MKSRIAASVAVWLLAVAFVASIAWLAIDTAGQQVTSAQAAAPLPTDGQTPTDTPPAVSATTTAGKAKKATHTAKPTHTLVPTITTGPPSPAASPVSGTFSSEVGRVRAVCTGSALSLDGGYAQPASGWSLRIVSQQASRIVIAFYQSGHQGLTLAVDCVNGQPRFYPHKITRSPPNHPNPSGTPVQ